MAKKKETAKSRFTTKSQSVASIVIDNAPEDWQSREAYDDAPYNAREIRLTPCGCVVADAECDDCFICFIEELPALIAELQKLVK